MDYTLRKIYEHRKFDIFLNRKKVHEILLQS